VAAPTFDPDHPRPTRQRAGWTALDGPWDAHLDTDLVHRRPSTVPWDTTIVVPFAPETPASGLGITGYLPRVWYRRMVEVTPPTGEERVLLHLGAVDREAWVWAGGERIGHHVGGSTPFTVDLTDAIVDGAGTTELVVRADDDPLDLAVPRGKQDWEPEPHEIFYPRTTGIWQRVWVERVPAVSIGDVWWRPDPTGTQLEVTVEGEASPGSWLEVALHRWPAGAEQPDARLLRLERVALRPGRRAQVVHRSFELLAEAPEMADSLRWWPHAPTLLAASLRIVTDAGTTIDEVATYTGLRTVAITEGKVTVNDLKTPLRLALDQGYWRSSGMTAPDGGALRADVEAALALGLNGVRKHQKMEDPRFLHWADRLGLLVWEEQPSAYRHRAGTLEALCSEWAEAIVRDRNHPAIVAWVPLNESWGVPLAASDGHRDQPRHHATIEALTALTRALDPTRLVSANDGWETVGGDIVGVHDYTNDPEGLQRRYGTADGVDETVRRRRPSGRRITLDGSGAEGRAVVVSELGGLTLAPSTDGLFTYGNTTSAEELLDRYGELCRVLNGCDGIAGWCWTQLTDTYQEANGLLDMDRVPKAPIDDLRTATHGLRQPMR
jgi:hypothetical protein